VLQDQQPGQARRAPEVTLLSERTTHAAGSVDSSARIEEVMPLRAAADEELLYLIGYTTRSDERREARHGEQRGLAGAPAGGSRKPRPCRSSARAIATGPPPGQLSTPRPRRRGQGQPGIEVAAMTLPDPGGL
jgi:hypothetical protein